MPHSTLSSTPRRRALALGLAAAAALGSLRPTRADDGRRPSAAGRLVWADFTESPRGPITPADARDRSLWTACGAFDRSLTAVAARLAGGELSSRDMEALTQALRAAGSPHVWPRAWTLAGKRIDRGEALARMKRWLATFHNEGERRCGLAWSRHPVDGEVLAAVVVDAAADLDPVPSRARPGSWVNIGASVLVPAIGAKVVVLGPTGAPRSIPTSLSDGRIQARFNADRPGAWLVQVLIDGSAGPRPVLEAPVFVGIEPPDAPAVAGPAPGEEAAAGVSDPALAVLQMIAAARRAEGLAPLARDPRLDRLARAHAEAMRRGGQVAHDAGDGDPSSRMRAAGLAGALVGENVAHAASAQLVHRALWASPSHRENLLESRFDKVGVGAAVDEDGTVWVTELFYGSR